MVVPAPVVAAVLEECAAAGVGCAVVITSGFAESAGSGAVGRKLQRDIAAVVARTGLRVLAARGYENVYVKLRVQLEAFRLFRLSYPDAHLYIDGPAGHPGTGPRPNGWGATPRRSNRPCAG